jgi:hypothetical protein
MVLKEKPIGSDAGVNLDAKPPGVWSRPTAG